MVCLRQLTMLNLQIPRVPFPWSVLPTGAIALQTFLVWQNGLLCEVDHLIKTMSRAIRALYRLCLRQALELEKHGLQLEFRRPMDRQAWMQGGSTRWTSPSPAYNIDAFGACFLGLQRSIHLANDGPKLAYGAVANQMLTLAGLQGLEQGIFSPSEVRDLVRQNFRNPAPVESEAEYIDRAITSFRVLSEQVYLMQCSSSCRTEGVVVEVTSAFMGRESELDPMYEEPEDTEDEKHLFTYRVRIANVGDKTVQVQARHWVITDAKGKVQELPKWAPAIVGARPTLEPGNCFEYYSRTDVDTREGTMRGAFQLAELNLEAGKKGPCRLFEVEVAPFKLKPPGS